MKKLFATLTATLLLTSCAVPAVPSDQQPTVVPTTTGATMDVSIKPSASMEETTGAIEVDKGLAFVDVTLPKEVLDITDYDEKLESISESKINEDGSVTYKMTRLAHEQFLSTMVVELRKSLEEELISEDTPSLRKISVNDDLTEVTIVVDRKKFENSMDGFVVMGLLTYIGLYQTIKGISETDYNFDVTYIDESTGEKFDTVSFPEALEDQVK